MLNVHTFSSWLEFIEWSQINLFNKTNATITTTNTGKVIVILAPEKADVSDYCAEAAQLLVEDTQKLVESGLAVSAAVELILSSVEEHLFGSVYESYEGN